MNKMKTNLKCLIGLFFAFVPFSTFGIAEVELGEEVSANTSNYTTKNHECGYETKGEFGDIVDSLEKCSKQLDENIGTLEHVKDNQWKETIDADKTIRIWTLVNLVCDDDYELVNGLCKKTKPAKQKKLPRKPGPAPTPNKPKENEQPDGTVANEEQTQTDGIKYPDTVSVNMPLTPAAAALYVEAYKKRKQIELTDCELSKTDKSITCNNPDNTKCTFTFSKFINENQFENDTAESLEEAQKKVREYANCSGTGWAAKNQNIVNCRVDGDGFQQEFKFNFKEIKNLSLSEEQQKLISELKSDIQQIIVAYNKRKEKLENQKSSNK